MPITKLERMGIYPETRESILGKGLKFPFAFTQSRKKPATSTASSAEIEHVNDAIWQILGTKIGDRFMRRDFGSRLHELIFEQLDEIYKALATVYVKDALNKWEKRIVVHSIIFYDDPDNLKQGIMPGEIRYTLIKTQQEGNLVYPFIRTPEGYQQQAEQFS